MAQTARKSERYNIPDYHRPSARNVKRPAPLPPKQIIVRPDIDIVKGNKSVFRRVLLGAVIFLGAFLCVFSFAYTEYRKRELNALQNRLGVLTRDNNALRSEINGLHNLTEVQAYATYVLGMVFPDESQIIYVDAVPIGFTVRHEVDEEEIHFRDVLGGMFELAARFFRTE
jgi:cell division protein FtsB